MELEEKFKEGLKKLNEKKNFRVIINFPGLTRI